MIRKKKKTDRIFEKSENIGFSKNLKIIVFFPGADFRFHGGEVCLLFLSFIFVFFFEICLFFKKD